MRSSPFLLICTRCSARNEPDLLRWRCDCGGPLDLEFSARFDLDAIRRRPPTLWRYREALPIRSDADVVSFSEGFTPLVEAEIGGRRLLLKLDSQFPTGSFKDRGATVLVSHAREQGLRTIVEDSSGNAGCAIAAYAARAGIAAEICVPESTSPAKLAQIRMYGARLHRIPGSRQATARYAMERADATFYASHVWNPYFIHGTKTFAYELWEQLDFRAPDAVVVPTGNGSLLLGASVGFRDLRAAGLIDRLPKLVAVQSERCAPLLQLWDPGAVCGAGEPEETLAEGIAIAEPARASQMLDAVRETGGEVLTVTEAEIRSALIDLGRQGIYAEPTAAVAVAGLAKHRSALGEHVVVSVTGHGLKSTEKILTLLDSGAA